VTKKIPGFKTFRKNSTWESYIKNKLSPFEENLSDYLKYWYIESRENSRAYPSQGLLTTPFDNLSYEKKGILPPEEMINILRVRQYFLELFNHPERIEELKKIDESIFRAPKKIKSKVMDRVIRDELGISISDLGIAVVGSQHERVSRKDRLAQGPFVKLGKKARSLLVGSAMQDVWGSVYAISTMAQCLCLTGVPRNGPFSDITRQADLAKEVFRALAESEVLLDRSKEQKKYLLKTWRKNVMGVVDANVAKSLKRADELYKVGVRSFRVYSPEPGLGALHTVQALRKEYGNRVEIFAGQVVDVYQAKQLENAGADGLYIGIGGGGRCTTGVRSGSVIDWPVLLWQLRGEIQIPVVVEGGASDNIATTLALGASGIGVSRIAGGGTVESPGGMLYFIDKKGRYFKPYGGEASARTKYLDDKILPFDIPSFVEGETRTAIMNPYEYGSPTIPFNVFNLIEDIILSYVFRGVSTLEEFHGIDPSPLRQKTAQGDLSQKTH
jgi:hypothetical protein